MSALKSKHFNVEDRHAKSEFFCLAYGASRRKILTDFV